jgi:hypothetical protein
MKYSEAPTKQEWLNVCFGDNKVAAGSMTANVQPFLFCQGFCDVPALLK